MRVMEQINALRISEYIRKYCEKHQFSMKRRSDEQLDYEYRRRRNVERNQLKY